VATPRVAVSTANTTSYVPLLNVSGVDGVLTSVGVASGKNYHYFQITIDGTLVVSDIVVGSNAQMTAANGGLGVALPFSKSLQVDIKDSPASSLPRFWASYVTSHTELSGVPEIEVFEHDAQLFLREHAKFGEGESRYTIETLLGPMRRCRVELYGDYFLPDEPIQGKVLLEEGPPGSHETAPLSVEDVILQIRPYGYSRVLDEVQVGYVEGQREFDYLSNKLIQHGTFEMAAVLPGFMNIPAVFYRT